MIWFLAAIVTYAFGVQSDNTKSELAYLLIKQSFLFISTDIQRFFEGYLRPPGRRFGIIKPLTFAESPACLKEPRCVFVLRSWFESAINLAIEEQVSQAVGSRNASSPKTKHPSWTYGSFAKLRPVSVLEIRTAFWILIIFLSSQPFTIVCSKNFWDMP